MTYANTTGAHTPFTSNTKGGVTGCQGTKDLNGGKKQRGGYGYGMSNNTQPLGQGGPSGTYAPISAYQNNAVNNPLNLNASEAKAYPTVTQAGGNIHTVAAPIPSGTTFYKSGGDPNADYGIYAGAGYAPISGALSHGDCSQSGGKRQTRKRRGRQTRSRKHGRRGRKRRKTRAARRSPKRSARRSPKRSARRSPKRSARRSPKRSARRSGTSKKLFRSPKIKYLNQGGGWAQYQSNVPLSHGYAQGAPPNLGPKNSMLANPPPTTRYKSCPDKI
jgi:hypothetical protein